MIANNEKTEMEYIDDLIKRITTIEEDIFDSERMIIKNIYGRINEKPIELILAYGDKDLRRSVEPLQLKSKTIICFCDFKNNIYPIGSQSEVIVLGNKAIQYSSKCGPEPDIEHFRDFIKLAQAMKGSQIITVVNLPGSGASVPQHFHTQIYPLQYIRNGERRDNFIKQLLKNFQYYECIDINNDKDIRLREIFFPFWGFEIIFQEDYSPEKIGEVLFKALQKEIRYRSQLFLSYNIYISSENPNIVTVLFKDIRKETPFSLKEIYQLMIGTNSEDDANKISKSDNSRWRWGWLEGIGGLPARDDSFSDTEIFNFNFWYKIYERVTVANEYRYSIRKHLICSLAYPRIAIYLLLSLDDNIYQNTTKVIGYDLEKGKDLEKGLYDEYIDNCTNTDVKYGCHITLVDTFTPNCNFQKIYKTIEPIIMNVKKTLLLSGTKFNSLKNIRSCLIMELNGNIDFIKDLHKQMLKAIQPFRVKIIEPEFSQMTERIKSIEQFGAPYVNEDYYPHLTVVSGIKNGNFDIIKTYIQDNYSEMLNKTFSIDSICIVYMKILYNHCFYEQFDISLW